MGLSRKLGGGTTRGEVSSHVDYTWSTQAYTIRDIITKFQLPCVVKCSGDAGTVLWADFRFDMRQPLLLHAARTVRKIHARSLQIREPSGDLEEFGPPLAIPEDYDGWFYPIGRGSDPTFLPRHTRVEGVAASPTRKFLVTTTLPAFTPPKGAATSTKHVPHEVTIGEVLTKVGMVKGDPSVAPASPSALVQRSRQSLRCTDENQHEIIIPFSHRSLLIDVAENYGPGTNSGGGVGGGDSQASGQCSPGVVHTQTLVNVGNKYLPRVFRHVLGDLPALAQTFTGLLRCYSVFTEETVMAATMSSTNLYSILQESSCLELATDSSAKFKIALNASELKKTHHYALALKTCEEQAPSYVRAIKTSFTVQPVATDLEDVVVTLYDTGPEQSEPNYQAKSSKCYSAVQTTSVDTLRLNENPSPEVVRLGAEHGSTTTCDHETSDTNDDDNESVMTDDVANSVVDTTSLSDATDIMCSDGVSDAGEVEANSEFDFSWGQLKRAKSFTGSLSTLTDDSDTSSTLTSESEDSVTAPGGLDSSVSQDSTVAKDTNSSASEDTVVLRTSAPSPVYANVPKKLSVFTSEQQGEASCEAEPSVMSNTMEAKTPCVQNVDSMTVDTSVRSVWNITPTFENQEKQHWYTAASDRVSPFTSCDDGKEADPIWWGDRTDDAEDDSSVAPQDFRERNPVAEEYSIPSLERPPKIPDRSSVTDHPQVSSQPSVDSTQGMTLASHSLLSSRLSVKSEGSAQDLAIQRLERAFDDANDFLNSTSCPSVQPAPPPRRQKLLSLAQTPQSGDLDSSHDADSNGGAQEPGFDVPVVQEHVPQDYMPQHYMSQDHVPQTIPATHSSLAAPLSTYTSQHSPPHPHTLSAPDRQVLYPPDHQPQAKNRSHSGYRYGSQEITAHGHTDPQPAFDLTAYAQSPHHQAEAQIDLDFVKALGDRLLAVSGKSSLPRYQRLHPEMDVNVQFENQDDRHMFRKKSQRAGRVPSSMVQDDVAGSEDSGGSTGSSNSDDGAFSHDWDYVESRQREAILTDLDLLEEEVV